MSSLFATIKQFPQNVWVLAITFSFAMTGISLLLFIGGIVGTQLAPKATFATLPLACFVVGSATMVIPAAWCLNRWGRKQGTWVGLAVSLLAACLGILAVNIESFTLLLATGFCIGLATPFYQQFRFALIESLQGPESMGPALSVLMLFNIVGALAGPEFGVLGRQWIPGAAEFTGSFLLFGCCILAAGLVFTRFQNPPKPEATLQSLPRPLLTIVFQPVFVVALMSAAIGYGVMSYLMTSTPISMHEHHGYALEDAKWVIQSHLVAMFLPSLFSGLLLRKLGVGKMMLMGAGLYLGVVVVALSGEHVLHYWWALVLLGIGWNFLFLSGTTLLPQAYTHAERFKAQAVNDFLIFTFQGMASLSAGWVLFQLGWRWQIITALPFIFLVLLASIVCIQRYDKT